MLSLVAQQISNERPSSDTRELRPHCSTWVGGWVGVGGGGGGGGGGERGRGKGDFLNTSCNVVNINRQFKAQHFNSAQCCEYACNVLGGNYTAMQ